MDELLTVKEAAEILKFSKAKVFSLIKERKIKASRLGWEYRIAKADLQEYIKNCLVR